MATLAALNFLKLAKMEGVEIATISLHKVDKHINERRTKEGLLVNDDEAMRQLIAKKLPHLEFADVFSKAASDTLPPHQPGVDHEIVLEKENNLTPSPLYSMSLEQLELVKAYLEDHLQRGFIEPSDAPYASPVLFAKKPRGGWRFYV